LVTFFPVRGFTSIGKFEGPYDVELSESVGTSVGGSGVLLAGTSVERSAVMIVGIVGVAMISVGLFLFAAKGLQANKLPRINRITIVFCALFFFKTIFLLSCPYNTRTTTINHTAFDILCQSRLRFLEKNL